MAKKLDQKEIATFEELFWANMYQLDAPTLWVRDRGFKLGQEFYTKLKQVQHDYESKRSSKQ